MKKLISVFLVFLLTFSLAFTLISCTEAEKGEKGDTGAEGPQGEPGKDGATPTIEISEDGYWVINGEKTEVKAQGEKGEPGKDAGYENPQGLDFFLKDDGTYAVGIGSAVYLSEIEIPATYNGKAVTEIGRFCSEDISHTIGSRLKKITLPEGVKIIGVCAFAECEKLTSLIIPNSVTTIGEGAFQRCRSLTSVTLGAGVTSLGEDAFYGCSSLTDVYYSGNKEQWEAISITASGFGTGVVIHTSDATWNENEDGTWNEDGSAIGPPITIPDN